MTQAQLIAGIAQIQVEQEQKLIELEGRLDDAVRFLHKWRKTGGSLVLSIFP